MIVKCLSGLSGLGWLIGLGWLSGLSGLSIFTGFTIKRNYINISLCQIRVLRFPTSSDARHVQTSTHVI